MLLIGMGLVGCSGRVDRAGGGLLAKSQQDPALSGNAVSYTHLTLPTKRIV